MTGIAGRALRRYPSGHHGVRQDLDARCVHAGSAWPTGRARAPNLLPSRDVRHRGTFDRQTLRREGRRPDRGNSGQRRQDLSVGHSEQLSNLLIEVGDGDQQLAVALEVTSEPVGSGSGVGRWRQTLLPPTDPVVRGGQNQSPRCTTDQRPGPRCSPANAAAQASTASLVEVSSASARPWPAGADNPGHSTLS